jgi:serine protease AprX
MDDMKRHWRKAGLSVLWVVLFMLVVTAVSRGVAQPLIDTAGAAKIDRWVLDHTNGGQVAEFLVIMNDQADLTSADRLTTKAAKGRYVYETLYATALRSQQSIVKWLQQRAVPYRSFYIVNAIWVKADRETALAVAARSDVARLDGNPAIANDFTQPATPIGPLPVRPDSVEPGIQYVNAPAVWSEGFTGQGIVVGGQDTGYLWNHPALQPHYRGWNGITVTHDYNWHDSIHATTHSSSCGVDSPVPCDDYGHGTHTMGTIVGDDGGANQIGMAPGAQWIGCRNMDNGWGTPATYIECFEFFLAPYPVGGTPAQGDPGKAPDVTNNSWSCPAEEGCNALSLLAATQAQQAAGILTVVSATNSGPSCSTVSDPAAIYAEAYTVGALNTGTDTAAGFSSRGPVTSDGSGRRKPDIAAPGTFIRSSTRDGGYGSMQGTSMAAPHVAGAVALVWSAHPAYRRQITFTENLLDDSAAHLTSSECDSNGWPNNTFGYGRLDVAAAVQRVITATQAAAPGFAVTYTLRLTNTTAITTPFDLETGSHQWPITLTPTQTVALAPGESAVITVGVTVPHGALATDFDALAMVATAPITPPERQYFALNTHVLPVYGLTLAPSSATSMAVSGYAAAYTLQLINSGNISDTIVFTSSQYSWPDSITPITLTLAAQQHAPVNVLVTVPLTAVLGLSDTVRINAQGTGVSAWSDLTTVAAGWRCLLPIIYSP